MPWDKRFAEPIVLEDGSKLATLQDAIAHLARLIPKAERDMPEILTAAELLTNAAAHGGPIEFARIATLQAINRQGVCSIPRAKTPNGDAAS